MEDVILKTLRSLCEPAYQAFTAKLIPTLSPETVLGVRLPQLRALARRIPEAEARNFLQCLPHRYLEENHLHSFLIDRLCRTYEEALTETKRFLPYVDNWCVCDSFRPKALRQDLPALKNEIRQWLRSDEAYTIRFALVLMLNWYLTDEFDPQLMQDASTVSSDSYYVNMALSWYFSMALVHQPQAALPLFENRKLPEWVHRKAIQKALESRQLQGPIRDSLRVLRSSSGTGYT